MRAQDYSLCLGRAVGVGCACGDKQDGHFIPKCVQKSWAAPNFCSMVACVENQLAAPGWLCSRDMSLSTLGVGAGWVCPVSITFTGSCADQLISWGLAPTTPSHPCPQSHISKGPAQGTLCQKKKAFVGIGSSTLSAFHGVLFLLPSWRRNSVPEPALVEMPVRSGARPVQVTVGGWKAGWGGVSGMSWEVNPRPGHWLGWAEGCGQSAWEMVPSELLISVEVFSLSVKIVGMAGWNVDIWARWGDDSGCPEGLFL